MRKTIKAAGAALLALVSVSCEKELDFKYRDIAPLPVIEATLTDRGTKVSLTLTTPIDEPMDRTRLTDATVTVEDLTDGLVRRLEADAEGYFTDPTGGVPGHDYRITLSRGAGIYMSQTTMCPRSEIRSLEFGWIKMPYDDVAVLKGVITDNPEETGEYWWLRIYRNGELYEWSELDDRTAVDGELSFVTMTSRRDTDKEDDDEVLLDGDVVTVEVCRITREMHDYLEAIKNGSNGPAMFSGPECLGYFMASETAVESIVFHPDQIGLPLSRRHTATAFR